MELETTRRGQFNHAFIDTQRRRLIPLAARVVGSDAEDVVQEALTKLMNHADIHRSEIDASAWLRRVTINLALNRRRDLTRWRARGIRGEAGLGPPALDPEELSVRSEERDVVRQVLDKLTPRSQSILLLRYSGYSYAEIAVTLEISPSSVGTTLARAERAFRTTYREMYP